MQVCPVRVANQSPMEISVKVSILAILVIMIMATTAIAAPTGGDQIPDMCTQEDQDNGNCPGGGGGDQPEEPYVVSIEYGTPEQYVAPMDQWITTHGGLVIANEPRHCDPSGRGGCFTSTSRWYVIKAGAAGDISCVMNTFYWSDGTVTMDFSCTTRSTH